jgi:hypothetical protein
VTHKHHPLQDRVAREESPVCDNLTDVFKGANWFERGVDLRIKSSRHPKPHLHPHHEDFCGASDKDLPQAFRHQEAEGMVAHVLFRVSGSECRSSRIPPCTVSFRVVCSTARPSRTLAAEIDTSTATLRRWRKKADVLADHHSLHRSPQLLLGVHQRLTAGLLAAEKSSAWRLPARRSPRGPLSEFSRPLTTSRITTTNVVDLGYHPFFVVFRAREIYDLRLCSGARLTVSYNRIGGVVPGCS